MEVQYNSWCASNARYGHFCRYIYSGQHLSWYGESVFRPRIFTKALKSLPGQHLALIRRLLIAAGLHSQPGHLLALLA